MSLYSRNKDEAVRAAVRPNVCRKHTTHTDEAFAVCFYPRLFIYFRTFRVLKSIAYLGPFNLKLYMLMVINSVISRWIQFLSTRKWNQPRLWQRSNLILKHPIWVCFRYMALRAGIKACQGHFIDYLAHSIWYCFSQPLLLFDRAGFCWSCCHSCSFIPGKRCPPQEDGGSASHSSRGPWQAVKRGDYLLSRWIN